MILVFSCALGLAVLILLELGRRIGVRRLVSAPQAFQDGTGVVDAAVFGLMGLLIAFTFSGAASRWEWRRNQIVQEANAIGTAYLRLDLLPAAFQPGLREKLRQYVRLRAGVYQNIPDIEAAKADLRRSEALQQEIWQECVTAAKETSSPAVMTLVLSNLNEMIDITTARTAALQAHLPSLVFGLLGCTALVSSLLAGYNMAAREGRSWIHIVSYTMLVSMALYLILELEYPRLGLIRIDTADNLLVHTLEKMK